MSFKSALKEIVDATPGAIGASIMGYDGIAIDEYFPSPACFDPHLLVVEYASMLKEIRQTVELLGTGAMEELTVTTAAARVVVRTVNDEFFMVIVLSPDGNYGKGRYLLRRSAPRVAELLS